jgi:UDP-N-acetylmuramyl tripeptide synthase
MSYSFYASIGKPFREIEEMLDWAKSHCASYITNNAEKRGEDWYYRFHFGEEKDYIIFKLRWS